MCLQHKNKIESGVEMDDKTCYIVMEKQLLGGDAVENCRFQELLELFLVTNNLEQLIEKAAQVLRNPLLICDTSYHFLGRSDVSGVRDKSWLAGVKRGGWLYELVSLINSLDLDYTGASHKTQILDSINTASTSRRMIGTLCIDGAHLGYYFILEEETPFAQIPEQVYEQVSALLAKSVSVGRAGRLPGGGRSAESIMLDLLQNGFDSRNIFLERAGKSDIARPGNYRIFCIPMPEDGADKSESRGLRSMIGRYLPLSWQVKFQGYTVVLANFSSGFHPDPDTLGDLKRFLEERGLQAGCSDGFTDPYLLKRYFEQAQAAAYLGRLFEDGRQVIPYEDYKTYDLFLGAQDEDLFTRYATEVVRRIEEYDRKNAAEYMDTLYCYLGSGCSVQKAAQKLYVHRNTVAYRVSKVKELFNISFDDAQKNYANYMSCLLHRYCERVRKDGKQDRGEKGGMTQG